MRKIIVYWLLCAAVSLGLLAHLAHAQDGARIATGRAGVFSVWHLFGFNADIASTQETVWDQGGLYSYITTVTPMAISSSSTNDTSAGTGARTVRIYGTNSSDNAITEDVTLSGQSAVSTTQSFWRVNGLEVLTAGSGATNAGSIYAGDGTVTSGVPSSIYAKVNIGEGRALMGLYHVPAGKRALLQDLTVVTQATSAETVTIELVARASASVFKVYKRFLVTYSGGPITIPSEIPLPFGSSTDIEVRAQTSSGGAARDVAAGATLIIVN